MRRQTALIGTLAALLHLGVAGVQAQTYNTTYGNGALQSNTTGAYNTAVGNNALYYNTTGADNTASGAFALYRNTTGNDNTASGLSALLNNTTGSSNTASGVSALERNTIGFNNTAVGVQALWSNTTGSYNIAISRNALWSNTTGSYNTAVGRAALQSNISGSNNIALGDSAGVNVLSGNNNIYVGHQGTPSELDTIRLGNPAGHTHTYLAGMVHASTVVITSDARLKTNITPLTNVLEKLTQLRGVSFDWNDEYKAMNRSTERREIGVLAQDVEAVFPELVTTWGEGYKAVEYGKLSGVLIEALKELQATTEAQLATKEAHIAAVEARLAEMDGRLVALERELATSRQANAGHEAPMQWATVGMFTSGPLVGGLLLAGWAFGRYRAGRRPW